MRERGGGGRKAIFGPSCLPARIYFIANQTVEYRMMVKYKTTECGRDALLRDLKNMTGFYDG